jgi:phosphoenolpyruvate phosphomutase
MKKKDHTLVGRSAQFRTILTAPDLEFLMEAHNGLSAKIGAGAGFKGFWASGLSVSAALGVRDNNVA